MRLLTTILFFTLLPLYNLANASKLKWQNEPISVFSIELGKPIPSSIPTCPPVNYNNYRPNQEFCKENNPYTKGSLALIKFSKIPMENILKTLIAFTYDGVVGSIHASALHDNYQEFRAILIERYGQPTKIESGSVRTQAGVNWPSETLTWSGKLISIQLHERFENITTSVMIVNHLLTLESRAKARGDAIKKSATEL